MTGQTSTTERAEQDVRFSARMLMLAVLCLLVVVLVMAFGLVYATTIAGAAQDSAERQEQLNDSLREDLTCRAEFVANFDLARGRLDAAVARALLHLGRDDGQFEADLDDLALRLEEQEKAATAREQSVTSCQEGNP